MTLPESLRKKLKQRPSETKADQIRQPEYRKINNPSKTRHIGMWTFGSQILAMNDRVFTPILTRMHLHSSPKRSICMMREGLEGSESPRRTAVASQQTLLHCRLKRATQAAIMQAVFLVDDCCPWSSWQLISKAQLWKLIRRILWTWGLEGDLVLDHVLVRIHDLNLCMVNINFSLLG